MPAGTPYFAWIDAGETTFTAGHMRWDEDIFSFSLNQEEGDPASLTIKVRRPRNVSGDPIGLLGPGRKIWCWFAFDCDGTNLVKFRGRLVGVPTSIFEELVTLEFVAKPIDLVAQKAALADTLRVLPFYDKSVIEPSRRSDPDVVLEGYTVIWHYDPETHVITVTDEINGEDGLVDFDGISDTGKVLYDGLGLTLTSGPLARVDVAAEYTWTQAAAGTVDLTNYLLSHWPDAGGGYFESLNASDWPKQGTSMGDGWEVADASAQDQLNFGVNTTTTGGGLIVEGSDGTSSRVQYTETRSLVGAPMMMVGRVVNEDSFNATFGTSDSGNASLSRNLSETFYMVGTQVIKATLSVAYKAERQCTERVALTLLSDVQPILTDPEDGEALRIDNVRSVNLSQDDGGEVPIGDPRRRSYIATARGNQSIEHLILLARAHLMKRARVVEISFAPKLARMPEITLRKNAHLAEPRVGDAVGKIIGYSLALDGADGRIDCMVKIGCAIGRGGSIVVTDGSPTYCTIDYAGADYQVFTGRTIEVYGTDTTVGYQPPVADPNDDGIDFTGALRAQDVIEEDLVVEFGPEPGNETLPSNSGSSAGTSGNASQDLANDLSTAISMGVMPQFERRAKFKLKSMKRDFASDYQIQVTDLKIPMGYDLEAT